MFKNKTRLVFKLFMMVWFTLFLQIFLKVTFNYWKPYTIPTEQLERLGEFIDKTRWIQALLNGIFYFIGNTLVILCGLQQWKYKNKLQCILVSLAIIICYLVHIFINNNITDIVLTIITMLIIPLCINFRKIVFIIIAFICSFIFLKLSLFLEGFVNSDDMNYIIGTFFNNDYYIMLVLNYMFFNLLRMRKESE